MDYQAILNARLLGKVSAHPDMGLGAVPHFAAGGALGQWQQGWNSLGQNVSNGYNNSAAGGYSNGSGSWLSKMTGNPAQGLTPQDNFQGQQAPINQMAFQPGAQAGAAGYGAGQGNLQGSYGAQMGTGAQLSGVAQSQGQLGQQIAGLQGQDQSLYAQQQGLANQLQNQANGVGPNPAQAQFQQNADQAAQQASGVIASQRGMNPALAAKMGAETANQGLQGAAGSEATLQAQQQVNAQQQLAAQQQAMGANTNSQAGLLGAASSAYGAQGTALGQQGSIYGNAGNTANDQAAQGNTMYGTNVTGNNAQNNTVTTGYDSAQDVSANAAANNQKYDSGTQAGLLNAGGGAVSLLSKLAQGGQADQGGGQTFSAVPGDQLGGAQNQSGLSRGAPPSMSGDGGGGGLMSLLAAGGSPAPTHHVVSVVDGKALSLAQALMAQGGPVPGQDPVPGKNDSRNDIVPTALSPKEIVLPLSVTESADPAAKAAAFVEAVKAKAHPTYGKVLQARKALADAQAKHQQAAGGAA